MKSFSTPNNMLNFLLSIFPTEPASFPLLSLEDEGIVTASSSAASTPQSQGAMIEELNVPSSEPRLQVEGTAGGTDA